MTASEVSVQPVTAPNRLPAGMVIAAIAIAAIVTAGIVAILPLRDTMWWLELDFKVYHVAASAVVNGISPFDAASADGYLFVYTPFAALTLAPLGLLNIHVAFAVWTFINMIALEVATWLALGLVAPDSPARRAKFALLATVAALPTAPVLMLLNVGQIGVVLMLLVLADLARRPGRFQGVALGIAAGIKLTPLIFVAYFLITRRIRAAVVSAATFVATVLIGFLVLPGPSARWWSGLVLDTSRMTPPGVAPFNQSIRGVLAQLPGMLHAPWLWLTLAIAVGLTGLAISAWYSRRGMEAVGIFACAVTGLLISPVSWPHHWVWLVPGLALWLWWARHRQSAAHALGVTLIWLVLVASGVLTFLIVVGTPNLASAGAVMPNTLTSIVMLNNLTVLAGLGFLGTLAAILWRTEQRSTSETFLS